MVKRITSKNILTTKFEKSVACIGYFDGVHIGHQKLINKAIDDAIKLKVKSSVICFEPDPVSVITGSKNKHLTSYKTRIALFDELGIDIVYVIKFDKDFMNLSAIKFIKDYLNKMNIVELVCGFDYSFGYKAKGNCELLINKAKFKTVVIKEARYLGEKVSSTRIKEALIKGNFSLVNKLLGYTYSIDVTIINCLKQGKKWLVKAKLSDPNGLLPIDGKYSKNIEIKKNRIFILGNKNRKKGSHLYLEHHEKRVCR